MVEACRRGPGVPKLVPPRREGARLRVDPAEEVASGEVLNVRVLKGREALSVGRRQSLRHTSECRSAASSSTGSTLPPVLIHVPGLTASFSRIRSG